MLTNWLFVAGGLAVLIAGGEALVRGASRLALLARVTPAVVGLTVVAAGTSMPELVVSVRGALVGSPGLAVGNIVGSNIFNIAAILGLAALIRPLRVQGNTVRLEWPVMMLSAFQFHLLARDGVIDRLEGGFLLTALVAFTSYAVWVARRNTTAAEREALGASAGPAPERGGWKPWAINVATLVLGAALLAGGASLLVEGAVGVASSLGLSATIIGLTIVAVGTSAPELITSIVAARRGLDDIAITNIIGSNIFNALGIGGATALIQPLPVPSEVLLRDDWWMLGASALLFPLMWTGMRINRLEGALLLAGYVTYVALLISRV